MEELFSLESKEIPSVLHKALVSFQSFLAEELPKTAVKAWKRRSLMEVQTN